MLSPTRQRAVIIRRKRVLMKTGMCTINRDRRRSNFQNPSLRAPPPENRAGIVEPAPERRVTHRHRADKARNLAPLDFGFWIVDFWLFR